MKLYSFNYLSILSIQYTKSSCLFKKSKYPLYNISKLLVSTKSMINRGMIRQRTIYICTSPMIAIFKYSLHLCSLLLTFYPIYLILSPPISTHIKLDHKQQQSNIAHLKSTHNVTVQRLETRNWSQLILIKRSLCPQKSSINCQFYSFTMPTFIAFIHVNTQTVMGLWKSLA